MTQLVQFLAGVIGIPAVAVVAVCVLRARWDARDLSPGSRRARRVGCACSRVRNLWGHREALTGVCVVSAGCPVLMHHPDRRRDMYTPGD